MPTREIFWQVQGRPLFYLLFVLAIIVAARGCYAHVRRWQIGTGGFPTVDVRAGIRDVLAQVFLHRRLLKERYAGIMHAFLFSGFCFLGLASAMVMLRADFGLPVYEGLSFLFTKFTANLFGMLAIAGIAMAAYRRYIKQRIMENRREDATLLGLLALILVTGFFLEAVHIAAVPTAYDSVSLLGSWLAVPLAAWGGDDAGPDIRCALVGACGVGSRLDRLAALREVLSCAHGTAQHLLPSPVGQRRISAHRLRG